MITRRFRLTFFPSVFPLTLVFVFIGGYLGWKLEVAGGWIALCLGILPNFFVSGAQVDPVKKKARSFVSFLGIKTGKWHQFEEFPELVLLSKVKAYGMGSNYQPRMGWGGRTTSFGGAVSNEYISEDTRHNSYELYAMDSVHEGRIMVGRWFEKDKAEEMANGMSATTGLPWVSYSPGGRFPKKRLDSLSP